MLDFYIYRGRHVLIIWRRHGWLILVFFLIAWGLADGVISPIYRGATGLEYLYNSDKGIVWAIALTVVAALIFGYNFAFLRNEGKQFSPEEWRVIADKRLASYQLIKTLNETDESYAARKAAYEADLRDGPVPAPIPRSTFFFIPMRIMPLIFIGIAVLLLILNIPTALEEATNRALLS